MNRTFIQGLIAAFAGGAIGAIVGLNLNLQPEWVGALISTAIGGVIGWISFNVKGFVASAKETVRSSRVTAKEFTPLQKQAIFWDSVTIATAQSTGIAIATLGGGILNLWSDDAYPTVFALAVIPILSALVVFGLVIAGIYIAVYHFGRDRKRYSAEDEFFLKDRIDLGKTILRYGNFVVLPFAITWLVVFKIAPWLWVYVVQLYRATVSSYRVSAMLGGATGALLGHLFENPLAGGFVGALVWTGLSYFHHAAEPVGS